MPVSHARVTAVTSADDELPGLLAVLARVPDPRRRRGRRYTLVFVLAVARGRDPCPPRAALRCRRVR